MGVGWPANAHLEEFGRQVHAAFGSVESGVYLVGSALTTKSDWRDVDVRIILSDEDYKNMNIGSPRLPRHNARWVSLCLAYSALGRQMTGGLPIDFQIQQQTRANEEEKGPRSALGIMAMIRRGE